jgi:hypothetical protein
MIRGKKNMDLENVPRCQHIKVNGTQCGSPALRNRRLCFFHDRIRRIRRMDHKTAGLMLYAPQTASANLRIADIEADDATDVVVDRDTVNATSLNGPQWFEEDFEDGTGSDEEDTDEEDTDEEYATKTRTPCRPRPG